MLVFAVGTIQGERAEPFVHVTFLYELFVCPEALISTLYTKLMQYCCSLSENRDIYVVFLSNIYRLYVIALR